MTVGAGTAEVLWRRLEDRGVWCVLLRGQVSELGRWGGRSVLLRRVGGQVALDPAVIHCCSSHRNPTKEVCVALIIILEVDWLGFAWPWG